jgi:hypothetical protein
MKREALGAPHLPQLADVGSAISPNNSANATEIEKAEA